MYQHERYDGKGYPDGLAGEEIPLESRILFIAESFDCIRSGSVFNVGSSFEKSIDEMRIGSGIQFDPEVIKPFLAHLDKRIDHNDTESLKKLFVNR